MLERLAADTGVIAYLMAAAGILGILAKIVNQITGGRHTRDTGEDREPDHTEPACERGRKYAEEHTPTDKTCKVKVRACMHDPRFCGKYRCICGKIYI